MTNEPTTIYLDPEEKKELQKYCIDNDMSLSEVLRMLIAEFLGRQT